MGGHLQAQTTQHGLQPGREWDQHWGGCHLPTGGPSQQAPVQRRASLLLGKAERRAGRGLFRPTASTTSSAAPAVCLITAAAAVVMLPVWFCKTGQAYAETETSLAPNQWTLAKGKAEANMTLVLAGKLPSGLPSCLHGNLREAAVLSTPPMYCPTSMICYPDACRNPERCHQDTEVSHISSSSISSGSSRCVIEVGKGHICSSHQCQLGSGLVQVSVRHVS